MSGRAALRPLAAWAAVVVVLYGLFVLAGLDEALWSGLVDAERPVAVAVALVVGLLAVDALLPVPSTAVMAASGAVLGAPLGGVANAVGLIAGFVVAMEIGRRAGTGSPPPTRSSSAVPRGHAATIAATRGVPVLNEAVAATAGHLGLDRRVATIAAVAGAVPVGTAYAIAADHLHAGLAGALATFAAVGAVQVVALLGARRATAANRDRGWR